MARVAKRWGRRWGAVAAVAILAASLATTGCSMFHEKPGHGPFSKTRARPERRKEKSGPGPFGWLGSMFKEDESNLAQTPEEFVRLERPGM